MKSLIINIALGVFWFLRVGVLSYSIANGLNFQGMEQNCILSFVVPRNKMKSSCDLDDKIKRRLNAIEMKVNIYKQQMAEVQAQLDKERRYNAEKMEKMERQVRESTASADMSFLVERRLALLENEFTQLNAEMSTDRIKSPKYPHGQTLHPFNALDSNPVTLPNLVKSMVQAEVKTMFDNFTRKFETYVREQILVYNQVFSIMQRPVQTDESAGKNAASKVLQKAATLKQTARSHGGKEGDLLFEFEKVKADLDRTGEEIARKVERFLQKNTSTVKPNSTADDNLGLSTTSIPNNSSDAKDDSIALIDSDTFVAGDILDSNDSFSGENPDSNETSSQETFTPIVNTEITKEANIRLGGSKEENSSDTTKEEEEEWKKNMIGDENYKQEKAEKKLRDEITALLYEPLAKVMSLVEKETAAMDARIAEQTDFNSKVTKDMHGRIKSLDQSIQSNSLQIHSLTKGFENAFAKLDKIKNLESLINEIKLNLTSVTVGMSANEFDQQTKKLKKLERLMNVYQQSLEHYKNETKHEYKEVRERMSLETLSVKKIAKNLRNSVSTKVDNAIDQMNKTYSSQLKEIKVQIRKNEDNIVYNQIDIENHDIQLNDKKDRTGRDLNDVKDTLSQVLSRNREFRKKIENLQKKNSIMRDRVNVTAQAIEDLKKEVRLNLMDSWMKTEFEYDASISDCFGDQYVRRIKLAKSNVKLIGVVLCSSNRYKILMSNSLQSTFLNIGDGQGLGEDHCEFIGATSEINVKLAPFKPTFRAIEGYTRDQWGQMPKKSFINAFKPSPPWYECGVSIP